MSTTAAITQLSEKLDQVLNVSGAYVGQEVPTPGGPDIIYHVDEAKWKARTARRLKEDVSHTRSNFFTLDSQKLSAFITPSHSPRWVPH